MNILSLDSSTESASCAVVSDEKLYGEITFNYKKQHSKILMPMVDRLLESVGMSIGDMDGFVVSRGPGSFTGLRIGAAVVKGLSQGTGKPFAAVSSLDALAYNMAYTKGLVCPMIDALRGNVYTAVYEFEDTEIKRVSEYMMISVEELIEKLKVKKQKVCFIGDGLVKYKSDIVSCASEIARFAPLHLNIVRASSLGEIGMGLIKKGICDDIYSFAPMYLRKSQAEREYDMKAKLKDHE